MNRYLTFSFPISMTLNTQAIPLRAANKPRAEMEKTTVQWTNEETEGLWERSHGLPRSLARKSTHFPTKPGPAGERAGHDAHAG